MASIWRAKSWLLQRAPPSRAASSNGRAGSCARVNLHNPISYSCESRPDASLFSASRPLPPPPVAPTSGGPIGAAAVGPPRRRRRRRRGCPKWQQRNQWNQANQRRKAIDSNQCQKGGGRLQKIMRRSGGGARQTFQLSFITCLLWAIFRPNSFPKYLQSFG